MVSWVVQNAVGAGVLALGVWALSRGARLSPTARHALWLVVILKLLAPPYLMWPWEIPSFEAAEPAVATSGAAESLRLLGEAEPGPGYAPAATVSAVEAPGAWMALWKRAQGAVAYLATREGFVAALMALWLLGSVVVAGAQGRRLWRFGRRARGGEPAPEWLAQDTAEAARRLGVRTPRMALVKGLAAPCLFGVVRPRLLAPQELVDCLDREAWRSILVHELAHLRRRDHWVGLIELAGACVWWWNPIYWYAQRRLRENAELACDAWVVTLDPERRRAYAEALLSVLESLPPRPQPLGVLGMGAIGRRLYERRLRMILRDTPRHRLTRAAAAGVVVLALAVLPGWAQEDEAAGSTESSPLEQALDKEVSIEFEDTHILSVLDYLTEYCDKGLNWAIDWSAVAPPRPLGAYADLRVLDVMPVAGGELAARIAVGPAGRSKWYKQDEAFEQYRIVGIDAGSKRVEIEDESNGRRYGMTPEQSAQYAEELATAPAAGGFATDGVVTYIHLENVKARDILHTMLRQMGLGYRVEGPVVWISTAERGAEPAPELPSLERASEDMAKKMQTPASIEFEDRHISEILDFASQYFGVNFVVDPGAMAPKRDRVAPAAPIGLPGVPAGGVGVAVPALGAPAGPASANHATEGMVRYIQLQDVPLDRMLSVVLRPLGLTYGVFGNVVYVSTPEGVAAVELREPKLAADAADLKQKLDAPLSIEFEDQAVGVILGYLGDYGGLEVEIDPEAKVGDTPIGQLPVQYLALNDVPAWQVLYWTLKPLGLGYEVRDGRVFVSTLARW